jgi:hypothetical protein
MGKALFVEVRGDHRQVFELDVESDRDANWIHVGNRSHDKVWFQFGQSEKDDGTRLTEHCAPRTFCLEPFTRMRVQHTIWLMEHKNSQPKHYKRTTTLRGTVKIVVWKGRPDTKPVEHHEMTFYVKFGRWRPCCFHLESDWKEVRGGREAVKEERESCGRGCISSYFNKSS